MEHLGRDVPEINLESIRKAGREDAPSTSPGYRRQTLVGGTKMKVGWDSWTAGSTLKSRRSAGRTERPRCLGPPANPLHGLLWPDPPCPLRLPLPPNSGMACAGQTHLIHRVRCPAVQDERGGNAEFVESARRLQPRAVRPALCYNHAELGALSVAGHCGYAGGSQKQYKK
eukprot:365874-Chlamydomonas_euryale.AAC.9